MIELENGKLSWSPKTVIFEGNEYLAPLDLLPLFVYREYVSYLLERQQKRNSVTNWSWLYTFPPTHT